MVSVFVAWAIFFLGGSYCSANNLRENPAMSRKYKEKVEVEFPTLDEIILTDRDLTTLAAAFVAANLNGTLCTECNFTAFAPINDAFDHLDQEFLALLLTPSWRMHLIDILSFHVTFPTVDRVTTKDFTDGQVLDMINGEQITVRKFKRGIELTSSQTPSSSIVEANLIASNGALHKIDSVLLPGFFGVNVFTLGDSFVDFTTLQELITIAGYNSKDGFYTILAPDNGAFSSMTDESLESLKNNDMELNFIVANHIIEGVFPSDTLMDGQKLTTLGGKNVTVSITESQTSGVERIVRFNGVPAVQSNLLAANGIAHQFESLVFDPDPASDVPSFVPSDVPSDYPSNIQTDIASIFDLMAVDPDLSVLDTLFTSTGLDESLEGEFTLLAPVNEAWFALGNETLARLLTNTAVLDRLLRSHLIAGVIPPSELFEGAVITSLSGLDITVPPTIARSLSVATQQSTFTFNGATSSDIYYASDGIIYVIDEVLFDPFEITLVPTPSPTISPAVPEVVVTSAPTAAETVEETPAPTFAITDEPTPSPTPQAPTIALCIDFDCDDGYLLVSDASTRSGNDRATCCYFGGICAGAPVGAMCVLGDIGSSLVSNPSFEDFSVCPTATEQLALTTGWIENINYWISSLFVDSPVCDDSWYRNGAFLRDDERFSIGSIPQNAADENAFVGTILNDETYVSYVSSCLNGPLAAGVEYTLTLNAAAPNGDFYYGGDTNGSTDLVCIPDCALLPYEDYSFEDSGFEIFTSAPFGGLIGGQDWKAITFNFVPTTICAAIAIGPNINQESINQVSILYDYLNLQEGAAGMCNAVGECVPGDSSASFCIDFDCGDGFSLVEDAATRPGNDKETCCVRTGVCAGAPVGAMCTIGEIESSLIPNPSFEEFSTCPNSFSQLDRSVTWVQATEGTSDYFVQGPSCDDTWYRNGVVGEIGSIPQNAVDGNAFVGSIKQNDYYEYIGACLNVPIASGVEYTFTLNVAAVEGNFIFGGDTDGATDLLCIPECGLFPIPGAGYKGNEFEILATAEPEGGLIGGEDWKTISFNFVSNVACPAIMFGPSENQTIQESLFGSYVIYDFLNLQEGAAGMCNADGECVPVDGISPPSRSPLECTSDDDRFDAICDDANACTIDRCIDSGFCTNIPVECRENEACDPIDGVCKNIDTIRPCIAVIDESDSFTNEDIDERWRLFRTNYPLRPFCLLIPFDENNGDLYYPTDPSFLNDTRAVTAIVNRDLGNSTLASDYLSECGYTNLAASGVDYVGLFVDESGSMDRFTVRASLTRLFRDLETIGLTYCTVVDPNEDWITPFNTELGGECTSTVTIDFPPTFTPTTFTPTMTASPTQSPIVSDISLVTGIPTSLPMTSEPARVTAVPTLRPMEIEESMSIPPVPATQIPTDTPVKDTKKPLITLTNEPTTAEPTEPLTDEPTPEPTKPLTDEPTPEPTIPPTGEPTPEPTTDNTAESIPEPQNDKSSSP